MHRDQLNQLTDSLNMARNEIEVLRHQEQEAALAAAETKQKVHAELVAQEEQMIQLRSERDQLHLKGNILFIYSFYSCFFFSINFYYFYSKFDGS